MSNFQKFFKHLHLVNTHRRYVRKMCFKMGIPWRGLVHDLSKYSHKEFSIYKFYNGKQSPHEVARKELGYSPSWLFHKARNKHHWEYWLDNNGDSNFIPVKIPYKYVIEMFCDFVGAGKAYMKKSWTAEAPLNYWNKEYPKRLYQNETKALLSYLFIKMKDLGEDNFVKFYKENKQILKSAYNKNPEMLNSIISEVIANG